MNVEQDVHIRLLWHGKSLYELQTWFDGLRCPTYCRSSPWYYSRQRAHGYSQAFRKTTSRVN